MSLNDFAKLVDYPQPTFSQIRAGTRPVPMHRVSGWADALRLEEDSPERERFLNLAALTHVPDEAARVRIERVLEKHEALKTQHQAIRRQLDEMLQQTPRTPPPPRKPPAA